MRTLNWSPNVVLLVSFAALWVSARLGALLHSRKKRDLNEGERQDFSLIIGSSLTLLGLIIGFTFSMASTRYDLRKNYEEAEANAIGTEYLRADLLTAPDGAKAKSLLIEYLNQRILFYQSRGAELSVIDARTAQLQNQLWEVVKDSAAAQPTPVTALAVAGMNDVLNSQGYTQAAWWNRIPGAAWMLMLAIAVFCNLLIGYSARATETRTYLFVVLPLVVSISFFLISDIDSPRRGIIRVQPQNLISLLQSLKAQ
jgi:hypothetical protein